MTRLSDMRDGDLVRLVRDGGEEAFGELYRRHSGAVYRFALQMSGSRVVAEEVLQEVFLAVIRGAQPANESASPDGLKPWLLGIGRNHVLRCIERDSRFLPIDAAEEETAASLPDEAESALEELIREQDLDQLRRAILSLPAPYREAVVLVCLQELSYEDGALAAETSVGTIRSRLHRARSLLAQKLRPNKRCSV